MDLLRMDLQTFSSEEVDSPESSLPEETEDFSKYLTDDGGLDVDSLVNDYKDSENHDENHQENAEEDTENSEEGTGDPAQSHEEESAEPEGEPHVNKDEPTEKKTPDAAFAEMRRRAEQNEKFAGWVSELATKQGFSDPEQLIEAFNQQQLAKEAEQKGVPVDVYERLQQLEQDNKAKDEAMFQERFNLEVATTKDKYNLSDEQINETFKFMAQRGFIDESGKTNIPFEDAYTLANKDTFIEKAKEEAQQDYLKNLEKKQKQASPDPKTASNDATDKGEIDLSAENVFATLEKLGIDYN